MHKAAQSELRLARRMARLGTETAFEVLVKAKALEAKGRDIIHLEIGEPDFDTPRNIIDAACDALHKGFTHYGPSAGLIELREVLDFRLDVDELASLINDRTKLIILNSPQNPTGGMLEKEDIEAVASAIGNRNIMILSDEIYSRLIFEGEHHSIMSLDGMKERTILLDGFSKTYAMTGWRMGYGVMRVDLATHLSRLMTNSSSCTASFSQIAGIEALRGPQESVDHMRDEFKKRRDVMVTGLNKIKGFSCQLPHGAFYVFPNITRTGWPSKRLADALLEDAGVAALSGTAFGEFGEGYLRFSVANSIEKIEKALDRIHAWTKKNL